ncbi:methionine ABC transporter ATP-binding protein [Alicyclobacillus dauci]|uniref:ATP-binding cassette domain-containing protein n=1 Tax=Alicyclobacillus dauci TaxID=1475485 RepID=A0ABY6Z3Y6_9BACL|nr:ATP-binding cassette domain-containing protein [Alicyclobacillus dauci]WAH37233.1 ATP-binding cassette domain-containing protein [Alicyclobacillus dauci]
MIQLTNVEKSFPHKGQLVHAVNDVTLSIEAGEIFGLIGYSGAGKSTLLRCMNLLEKPTSGRVVVDGQELTTLSKGALQKARRKIGMIFQHFHLLSSATVADNIAFPLRLEGMSRSDIKTRVEEMLHVVGLDGYESKYPSQLSGGQKQRVAIARALANKPDILLCDEATSALDPETTGSILKLLLDINRTLRLTIVIVTHQMEVVREICDRVAVMSEGKIVETGSVADILVNPTHPVTRRLTGMAAESAKRSFAELAEADASIVQIAFQGSLTYEPVLADVAVQTGCRFSILQGSIDLLKDVPYGRLTLKWTGDEASRRRAIMSLQARGCTVTAYESETETEVGASC